VKNRVLYDPSQSPFKGGKGASAIGWADEPLKAVAEDSDDRDMKSISFAMGEIVGEYYRDQVCLSSSEEAVKANSTGASGAMCGLVDFVVMTEESNDPFSGAVWDGVLGLGLDLSDAPEFSVLSKVFEEKKLHPVFSYFVSGFGGQINFGAQSVYGAVGGAKPEDATVFTSVGVSVPGYWQFELEDITIGGQSAGLCSTYKHGKCQAVVDTGSSLLMGPRNMIAQMTKKLDLDDKCEKANIPSIGFLVRDKKTNTTRNLELQAEDYLDRSDKDCYISMMSVGDMGRGPLVVLGYPFLRSFYTVFDFESREMRFASNDKVVNGAVPAEAKAAEKTVSSDKGIVLKGIRPAL